MIDFEKLGWKLAGSHDPQTCARMTKALRQLAADVLEEAAREAGGATGPMNVPEHAQGYSAACRDIAKALRTRAKEIMAP